MSGDGGTARHLEVERKFDVSGIPVRPPSFEGVATVRQRPAQALDAVYFDTAGHDLAANRITLRRRTGGTDAGWHLKLPAGPDRRTELRIPLIGADAGTVPDDLRDVVLAIIRDRPLAPVARIATDRHVVSLCGADGTVLAEFCDDQVTASVIGVPDGGEQRWREWELELVDTSPAADPTLLDRLSGRLRDAGATPAGHGSKLARTLGSTPPPGTAIRRDPVHAAVAAQVGELLGWDRAVRDDADDAVHQMRVTIRRIRSLLQASAGTFGLGDDWLLNELRRLAGLLGVARDAEVLAQRYRAALDGLPPELVRGPVPGRLVGGAVQRYRAGRDRALAAMRAPRYFRLLDGLDALVDEPTATVTAVGTPVSIDAAHRRVRKAARAARAASAAGRDEALHRIRKAAKRLRYLAAATNAPRVAEQAKVIQTLLGDHQDSVVSRAHLLQQAAAAHAAGEDTFSYGLLYQREEDLARDCRDRLDAALADLDVAVAEVAGGRAGQ